jgi:hypothetical protein
MQGEDIKESIKQCMALVKECGAPAGSAEHFMASKQFVKAEHREVFLTIEESAQMLAWLKRWCEDKKNILVLCVQFVTVYKHELVSRSTYLN